MNRIFPDLPCAQAGCENRASYVIVQTSDLQLLFQSMAGVVCDSCVKEFKKLGGVPVSFMGYGKAASNDPTEQD